MAQRGRGRRSRRSPQRRQPQHVVYSLWTAPPATWQTPLQGVRIADIARALEGLRVDDEHADDERMAAFRTSVTSDVLALPTQD